MTQEESSSKAAAAIAKAPTGVTGLDEVTNGGLPAGRSTLVCGGPGCGKTALAMEFLVRGALEFEEPGLFVSFEESSRSLVENFRSLGFDLAALTEAKKLGISSAELWREEFVEAGDFSLDGLRIRLAQGIREIGAKRLVLDTVEALFSAFSRTDTMRREFARLVLWLREQGVTTVVTGERGKEELTRHGFEEYVSDCVLLLDHRINAQISKRRLRVLKYRGSSHGADEYPFLIGKDGFSVLPVTSLRLDYGAGTSRCSSGIQDLDEMLGGRGYFRGSTVLVTGKAGTGKSSLAAAFAAAACAKGERCLYLALEESAAQLLRNMRSIGIHLEPHLRDDALTVHAFRATSQGLEEHLLALRETIDYFGPAYVVMDPITNFVSVGAPDEVKSMFTRLMDHLKKQGITVLLTALTPGSCRPDETDTDVSSAIDTWIALDRRPVGNTRRREIYIVKSRGMEHSDETRELVMSSAGLSLPRLKEDGHT